MKKQPRSSYTHNVTHHRHTYTRTDTGASAEAARHTRQTEGQIGRQTGHRPPAWSRCLRHPCAVVKRRHPSAGTEPSPPHSLPVAGLSVQGCVSLWVSVSLPESQSLHDVPGAAASTQKDVGGGGGGEGASPGRWEPQCHAPRLPNSAGRRRGRAEAQPQPNRYADPMQTELRLSPQPLWGALPLPADTRRDGGSAGVGGETERRRDTWRGAGRGGDRHRAGRSKSRGRSKGTWVRGA